MLGASTKEEEMPYTEIPGPAGMGVTLIDRQGRHFWGRTLETALLAASRANRTA